MNDRVRIVHVINGGEFGGAERYVLNLVTRLDPGLFEPAVACGYEGRFSRSVAATGVPVWVLPPGPRGLRELAARLRSWEARLVHTHGVRGNFFGRLAAWDAGIPLIVTTVHSHFALDYPEPAKRLAYGVLESLTAPMVTRYVAVSQALRRLLVDAGIDPRRVTVIPNGVDTAHFRPRPGARARLAQELGLSEDIRLVGMVARFHPVKGHGLFLRAAAAFLRRPEAPPVRFLVVGSGEPAYRRRLEELARELGVSGAVTFLGEREDVAAILAGLDAVVVPSRFEGFCLSALEAMASGVPVVATRVGAIPELIADGVNGLLAPPEDAEALAACLSRLLGDGSLAARIAGEGLATARRYSLDAFAARTAAMYRELLARAG